MNKQYEQKLTEDNGVISAKQSEVTDHKLKFQVKEAILLWKTL